ncbi:methyl-accepting chemotaxis sensory transducer with GAF sensor [Fischerella sp. NIES-4106]|nr:methyl-accepting chemotaxis sensory transducer with GAF sensor [Fischerella sp. NIES-4106]
MLTHSSHAAHDEICRFATVSHGLPALFIVIKSGAEQAISGMELVEKIQQQFTEIITVNDQMQALVMEIAQTASVQAQTSTSANQSILKVADIASQTSKQALAVSESLAKLATFGQDSSQSGN